MVFSMQSKEGAIEHRLESNALRSLAIADRKVFPVQTRQTKTCLQKGWLQCKAVGEAKVGSFFFFTISLLIYIFLNFRYIILTANEL